MFVPSFAAAHETEWREVILQNGSLTNDTNETKKKKQFSFLQMKIPSARVRPFSFTPDYPLPSFTYHQRNA